MGEGKTNLNACFFRSIQISLSQFGTALKKLMPKYRIKRYGYKTLGELYERLDRYELVKTEKGVAGMVRRERELGEL